MAIKMGAQLADPVAQAERAMAEWAKHKGFLGTSSVGPLEILYAAQFSHAQLDDYADDDEEKQQRAKGKQGGGKQRRERCARVECTPSRSRPVVHGNEALRVPSVRAGRL